jgi:hypothetical protein
MGISEEVVQVAQRFLIGTDEKRGEVVLLALLQVM